MDARYVGRATEGARDNDLYTYVNVGFGNPREHPVVLRASGRASLDLDRQRDPSFPFRSLEDARGKDGTGYLYTAYVELDRRGGAPLPGPLGDVRVGRQALYDTPQAIFLDGVSATTAPATDLADLELTAWGGLPSNIFESSPSGDWAAGAAAAVTPWTGGRLRGDYMHLTDRYLSVTSHDDLLGIRLDQTLGRSLFADAHFNALEGDPRDAGLGLTWQPEDEDLTLSGRWSSLWTDQNRHSIELDDFTPLLQSLARYQQGEVSLHKGLGDRFFVEGGVELRELADDADEGVFNHEFQRYWLSPGTTGWPWSGLDANVTLELWDAGGDEFHAYGAEATQDLGTGWQLEVGSLFELFRYDALLGQENEQVQVSYTALRLRAGGGLTLRASFEYEDGETDDFFEWTLGARIDF